MPRPIRKNEFTIVFATRSAKKGWLDLCATSKNLMVECWEFLTMTPEQITPLNIQMRAELAKITKNGQSFQRWQYKPSVRGTSRIWFYVEGNTVYLEQVHTSHPNQTK